MIMQNLHFFPRPLIAILLGLLLSSCVEVLRENIIVRPNPNPPASFAGVQEGGSVSHSKIWVKFLPATGGSGQFIYRAYLNGASVEAATLSNDGLVLDDQGYIVMMIGGLKINTKYLVQVNVYDSVTAKVDGNIAKVKASTLGTYLPEFDGIAALTQVFGAEGTTTLVASWSPAAGPNVTIGNPFDPAHSVSGYNLYYCSSLLQLRQLLAETQQHNLNLTPYPSCGVTSIANPQANSWTIGNLTPGQQYYAAVRARQSSTPTPYYEQNLQTLAQSTLSTVPFNFNGILSASVPLSIAGFIAIDTTWMACSGCQRYQVYVRPAAIGGPIDPLVDTNYLVNTISDASAESAQVRPSFAQPEASYKVFVLGCKGSVCEEYQGEDQSQQVTMLPAVAPFTSDGVQLTYPEGAAGMVGVKLNFQMDLTRGYYTRIKVYQILNKNVPPTSIQDLSNPAASKLLTRAIPAGGGAYLDPAAGVDLTYANTAQMSTLSATITGLTTGQEACFLLLPVIEAPDVSGNNIYTLAANNWPSIQCGTPEYVEPVFGVNAPRPSCTSATISKITVSWNAPAEAGIFSDYEVYLLPKSAGNFIFSDAGDASKGAWAGESNYLLGGRISNDEQTFTIENLSQDTEYIIGVNTYYYINGQTIRRAPLPVFATVECATAEELLPNECPENYLPVPRDLTVGVTHDFCVAKYEMKNVGGIATSQADLTPWVSISQTSSQATCSALNIDNSYGQYALISNPEWMNIARNVEQIAANWSNSNPGVHPGVLARGHSDNSPANALIASTDDLIGYINTGNNAAQAANAGWEQRRTLELSNGEIIWDFAGNVWEWVDWQVAPAKKAYRATDGQSTSAWLDFKVLDRLIGENADDQMLTSTFMPGFSTLGGANGLGQYYAGANNSGGAAFRGGLWYSSTNAGAFALHLIYSASSTDTVIGFRCVVRP